MLIQLPIELQSLIIDFVKEDNHLNLAPLAQTCKFYSALVIDRSNWKHTVTLLAEDTQFDSMYLAHAFRQTSDCKVLSTYRLEAAINCYHSSAAFEILKNQHSHSTIKELVIMMPSVLHHTVYETLVNYPQQCLEHLSIRDPTDDSYVISIAKHRMILSQFLSVVLITSRSTLKTIDIPSFCARLLESSCYQSYQFHAVNHLSIAFDGSEKASPICWKQLKCMFPNLKDLKLTLNQHDLPYFRSLLKDVGLFPWIKRLSVHSNESLKTYFTKEELKASLLQIEGLNRITAGWDIIAL
ncbi:hypothetical protein A0J61_01458 [Choanephora cucurbitarum]|uniref:F-box domain-containing protein n=1 Tax=Choanephora cucurbitarum TaxID=101091 RepID=A0A1C7NNB0_9FUNG|nr:hypothetical protein A0J61_01458 [Choanephora cucurbitarum]